MLVFPKKRSVKVKRGRQKGDGKKSVRKYHDKPLPFPSNPILSEALPAPLPLMSSEVQKGGKLVREVRGPKDKTNGRERDRGGRPGQLPGHLAPISRFRVNLRQLCTSGPAKLQNLTLGLSGSASEVVFKHPDKKKIHRFQIRLKA